jgi:hypothetical protein
LTQHASVRRRKKAINSRCSDRLSRRRADRQDNKAGGVAEEQRRERRLDAKNVEAIFRAFAEVMRELPPDTEAGWLDAQGDLRLAPDIGRKLRTARNVRDVLRQIRLSQNEREAD